MIERNKIIQLLNALSLNDRLKQDAQALETINDLVAQLNSSEEIDEREIIKQTRSLFEKVFSK